MPWVRICGLSWLVGEWVVNGRGGFVGCQWRRWRLVSMMRIGKVGGKKKKKKEADENWESCEGRLNNNILMKWRRN